MPAVTVSVSGSLKFSAQAITGLTMSYGINMIPTCMVKVVPTDSSVQTILQNQEQYLRQSCTISVSVQLDSGDPVTTRFIGLFDGFSFGLAFGSYSVQAVFKSAYQVLLETYSKLPGLNPMGINPFQRVNPLVLAAADGTDHVTQLIVDEALQISITGDVLSFYLTLAQSALIKQQDKSFVTEAGLAQQVELGNLIDCFSNATYLKNVLASQSLLANFNFDAVSGIDQDAASATNIFIQLQIIRAYSQNSERLWENLVQFYNSMGCNLIVSNQAVYVVPNNGFIVINHPITGSNKNVGLPTEYNQISFDNNGYRDVGLVAIVTEAEMNGQNISVPPMYKGSYPGTSDPLPTSGGIEVVKESFLMYLDSQSGILPQLGVKSSSGVGPTIATGNPNYKQQLQKYTPTPSADPVGNQAQAGQNTTNILITLGNNYAQLRLYQLRYGDRSGRAILQFNTNFVPGASAAFYEAKTKAWLDCFVTGITHILDQESGDAKTIVNFSCGRYGITNPSIDSDLLFNYDQGKMTNFINQFVSDIGSTEDIQVADND